MTTSTSDMSSFYTAWFKEILSPATDYIELVKSLATKPNDVVEDIKNRSIDVESLAKALIGGLLITGAIDLASELFISKPEECSSEIITTLLSMIAVFVGALILHPPLKWLGGSATLEETFFANTMVAAASPPIASTLILFSDIVGYEDKAFVGYISIGLLYPILSSLHNLSWKKIAIAFIVSQVGILLLISGVIAFFYLQEEEYGTLCRTSIGTCQVESKPVGNSCTCYDRYYQTYYGTVE